MEGRKPLERTEKDFPEALRDLMAEFNISFPVFERLTKERAHRKLSRTMLNNLALGYDKVNKEQIEIISAALLVDPTYFKEYREFLADEKIRENPKLADALLVDNIRAATARLADMPEEDRLRIEEEIEKYFIERKKHEE